MAGMARWAWTTGASPDARDSAFAKEGDVWGLTRRKGRCWSGNSRDISRWREQAREKEFR